MKNLLQGKPLGHPLHTLLVHFPIGLFTLSLVLDVASLLAETGAFLVTGAWYTMAGGILTALLAAVTGLIDRTTIRTDHPARKIVNVHMSLNVTILTAYVANLIWRAPTAWSQTQTPMGPLLLSVLAVGGLVVSGFLGGHLVYKYGIGVGRHRRETDLPERTLKASSAGSTDGWVGISDAAGVPDRHSLRLELDGVVMTIVHLNEAFYAVQEFCTHRCGPLSEGRYQDGEVTCPWHRSRFSLKTGEVTHGPAKLDLPVFQVRVRDGQLEVKSPKWNR